MGRTTGIGVTWAGLSQTLARMFSSVEFSRHLHVTVNLSRYTMEGGGAMRDWGPAVSNLWGALQSLLIRMASGAISAATPLPSH